MITQTRCTRKFLRLQRLVVARDAEIERLRMNIDFYKGVESVQKAEIERLKMDVLAKHSLVVAFGVVIQDQTAEIERLKKCLDQAIKRGDLRMATPRDEGHCQLTQQLPVWEDWDRELYAYLKEKENGN